MPRLRDKLQHVKKANTTPAASAAKAAIRRNVLQEIGPEAAHVFDAYAGSGEMYRLVWREAASYVGCDKEYYPDDRLAYVVDNVRLMRAIDLYPFNIFDFDAHGSPWEQIYIMAVRRRLRPGESLGIVITEGQGMKFKLGGMSRPLAVMSGMRHFMPGLASAQPEVIDRALNRLASMMDGSWTRRWEAVGKGGSTIRYIGLVLRATT